MIPARALARAMLLAGTVVLPGARHPRPRAQTDVTFIVRCDVATHPINPQVYGIASTSMAGQPGQWELGATGRRWGGNHTSRYNWRDGNATNTGRDWFFENVDYGAGNATPAYERFIEEDLAHGVATVLTVPTIGWVAKDTRSYGFPASVFGAQQATAPESVDIGNGVGLDGRLISPGAPERTSVPMTPTGIAEWVHALRRGTVRSYVLDNEPTLWNETHRDVHPEPVSYDELLRRTIAYASAIRRADPTAIIAGPALWGWDACKRSAVDRAARRDDPDRRAHEGLPLLAWWLREVRAYENRTGVHLIDLVDVHFYPQGRGMGIGASGGTDTTTAARRIRSTRALWDPYYVDESWLAEPVALVPHLQR